MGLYDPHGTILGVIDIYEFCLIAWCRWLVLKRSPSQVDSNSVLARINPDGLRLYNFRSTLRMPSLAYACLVVFLSVTFLILINFAVLPLAFLIIA